MSEDVTDVQDNVPYVDDPTVPRRQNASRLSERALFDYAFQLNDLPQRRPASAVRKAFVSELSQSELATVSNKNSCCRKVLIIIAIVICAFIISGVVAVMVVFRIDDSNDGKHKSNSNTNSYSYTYKGSKVCTNKIRSLINVFISSDRSRQ